MQNPPTIAPDRAKVAAAVLSLAPAVRVIVGRSTVELCGKPIDLARVRSALFGGAGVPMMAGGCAYVYLNLSDFNPQSL